MKDIRRKGKRDARRETREARSEKREATNTSRGTNKLFGLFANPQRGSFLLPPPHRIGIHSPSGRIPPRVAESPSGPSRALARNGKCNAMPASGDTPSSALWYFSPVRTNLPICLVLLIYICIYHVYHGTNASHDPGPTARC